MIGKVFVMTYALLCWLVGTAAFLALVFFLSDWLPSFSISVGEERPVLMALCIDSGLMMLWMLQHIGMARPSFKNWLSRVVPAALERSTYLLFTGITVAVMILCWSPANTSVYTVYNPLFISLIEGLYVFGWGYATCGILYDSYLEFNGLKQAYLYIVNRPFRPARFKTGFVFKLCRRPTFFGILLACWATHDMTLGHLHFALSMTLFTLIGCYFVERSYVQIYGDSYRQVQKAKPLLIPNPLLAFR